MSLASQPHPLGATVYADRVNFAVHAPKVSTLLVCLFHPDTNELVAEYEVSQRTGTVWHVALPKSMQKYVYLYKAGYQNDCHGDMQWQFLSDPYTKQLNSAWFWDKSRYETQPEVFFPKAKIVSDKARHKVVKTPRVQAKDRVIYEMHVKGLTRLHPQVSPEHRGTYLGVTHPAVIAHLKALGVTTVQVMPLMAFMPEPFISEKGLTNYWGYNTIAYFAPEPRYAHQDAHVECQDMVSALHDAGLEVILDVVFNHTAEGGPDGPTLSLRGFDDEYYTTIPESTDYANYSGCGNSVNVAYLPSLRLVMDAMRWWVTTYQIDGFRFDLATGLGRSPHAFSQTSALLQAMQQDPVLCDKIFLAEPWDIGDFGYQLGQFPSGFLEVNDQFRDAVRGFWRGDKQLTPTFATRMFGSRDIFHKGKRAIHSSVNAVTIHDGFTLHDLVTYSHKHNEANQEQNQDGHNHNLSSNYGVEGETDDVVIRLLRARQKRNLFASMIFAQGTPCILAGDELSRTQQGNNNAYCQDNELNYVDWDLNQEQQDFLLFCQYCVGIKQSSDILTNVQLADDAYYSECNVAAVHWYKITGEPKGGADWHTLERQGFGIEIIGGAGREDNTNEHWLLCVNAAEQDETFVLPTLPKGSRWQILLDTRMTKFRPSANYIPKPKFVISNRSIVLFKKELID
jgi:glycogen operon protein